MKTTIRPAVPVIALIVVMAASAIGVAGCENQVEGVSLTTTSAAVDVTITPEESSSTEAVTSTSEAASTTTEGPTASKNTATTLASTEVKLSNGHIKSLGFIHNVWIDTDGRRHLTIDYCDILYGDEATAAARAAGAIGPNEEVPVYVRNQSTRLREWLIADNANIVTCTRVYPWDPSPDPPCSWSEFVTFWKAGVQSSVDQGITDFYGAPWWIERSGDTVVKISEQFMS